MFLVDSWLQSKLEGKCICSGELAARMDPLKPPFSFRSVPAIICQSSRGKLERKVDDVA